MNQFDINDAKKYVEEHIGEFHADRLDALKDLKLGKVLKRKNPYLFKAKNVETASEIVSAIVNAYVSSQEETLFGNWLEGLAIFINEKVYGGMKSATNGLDLEFTKGGTRYLVSIKSGPSWGNASQIDKMISYFIEGQKRINTSKKKGQQTPCVFINGCCYGIDNSPKKVKKNVEYYKYCGQKFWYFISGIATLYTDLIEPIGYKAKEKNDEYNKEYAKRLNVFTAEFIKKYCKADGSIDWDSLVIFNSKAKDLTIV